jgi:UDP-N-acetyl-2-amino-2-deoxyglucuronate dehydrogenase
VDYVSICSPNFLHDSHIRLALRNDAHAICEKPIVLNPWNIESLKQIERENAKKIYTILQLRLHPNIIKLKNEIDNAPADQIFDIDLTYITSRGMWYHYSWKGDEAKSGGVATNIGVHFFDMLTWIFGDIKENFVHLNQTDKAGGFLMLKKARVRWFLSLDYNDIPEEVKLEGKRTFRSIQVSGKEIEFSDGFTELHTNSYKEILNGNGFGIEDAKMSVQIVHELRTRKPVGPELFSLSSQPNIPIIRK